MPFVELQRMFAPLERDEEPNLDVGLVWDAALAGWLSWEDLRDRRRVVLLAEASSGKTEEFRNQADELFSSGQPAFYLRIEELADQGLEAALDAKSTMRFNLWRNSSEEGWLFLDSIDEARLNRKSFETAIKRLAHELEMSLDRAHIFISCRATDWKGTEDRAAIERWLPARQVPKRQTAPESALLGPIFEEIKKSITYRDRPEKSLMDLLVVQLVPLSSHQYRALATKFGVSDVTEFVAAIEGMGLRAFAERPGDLIDLAAYWRSYGRFGTLADMVEHGVSRKLREFDSHRSDNDALPLDQARRGAERLAAALTLAKSFTLRAPNFDPDPGLAGGALDPTRVLDYWNEAQRNALLRRGLFAPATYGRLRFHHRSTQEYLAAGWLASLLQANCKPREVWNLIFAERYGIESIVPSLRPVAAWLALKYPEIRDEIIRREPLTLIRHGDPRSFPTRVRERILLRYAGIHAAEKISDDGVDRRNLRAFSAPDLAGAIKKSWKLNSRAEFRLFLLRLIREGRIARCASFARLVEQDRSAKEYHRIVAIQALAACEDTKSLKAIARSLKASGEDKGAYVGSEYALVLYPKYMSVDDLFAFISISKPSGRRTLGGFGHALKELYCASPDMSSRAKFIEHLADLCLAPPFDDHHVRISKRYRELAKAAYSIVQIEVKRYVDIGKEPTPALIKLLMVAERAGDNGLANKQPKLDEFVQSRMSLNRALFWADVSYERINSRNPDQKPFRHWHIFLGAQSEKFWAFAEGDLNWLYADLRQKQLIDDRRIALSAILSVLDKMGRLQGNLRSLRDMVAPEKALVNDLDRYLNPPENAELAEHEKRFKNSQIEEEKAKERDKSSWIEFANELRNDPTKLSHPENLSSWSSGIFRLRNLMRWLEGRTGEDGELAVRQWRLLEEGFGREVAEEFRSGMKHVWRLVRPERPKERSNNHFTTKWTTILAYLGLRLESSEAPDWAESLTAEEALLATKHSCWSGQGYPTWIEALLDAHPRITIPVLRGEIRQEWNAVNVGRPTLLPHYGSTSMSLRPSVQKIVIQQILRSEAGRLDTLNTTLRVVRNMSLTHYEKSALGKVAGRRFEQHASNNEDMALGYLAMMLLLYPDENVSRLAEWLDRGEANSLKNRVERTFGLLFDRDDALISEVLERASVATLEKFLHLAYRSIRPQDDVDHEGVFAVGTRERAESARNAILSALLRRHGEDSYQVLRRAAERSEFTLRKRRFRELAQGKAESDAEIPSWDIDDVLAFERSHLLPIKSGADLFRIVGYVLEDIATQLSQADVTSRPLLERANNEEEVQHWLAEQIKFRSSGRFHVYREAEVANRDVPDLIVASTTSDYEVAIEVKHGGKGWSIRDFEDALRFQLLGAYLKPEKRRYGFLVITHHKKRFWVDPYTGKKVTFAGLIARLGRLAETLVYSSGAAHVQCIGIDACLNYTTEIRRRRRS